LHKEIILIFQKEFKKKRKKKEGDEKRWVMSVIEFESGENVLSLFEFEYHKLC
jgi:hypothetical protein